MKINRLVIIRTDKGLKNDNKTVCITHTIVIELSGVILCISEGCRTEEVQQESNRDPKHRIHHETVIDHTSGRRTGVSCKNKNNSS